MLPKIQAAEAIQRSTEIAVGNGTLKSDEGAKIMREWRRAANVGQSEKPKLSKQQFGVVMAGMGIGVRKCRAKN